MTKINYADLVWDEQGQPISTEFDDVYFSKASGLEETEYVFLKHNQLFDRFKQLKDHDFFVIGETGFGSGLNFLCSWRLFEQIAPTNTTLHYISVEKHPLTKDDLTQALSLWDDLAEWRDALLEQYVAVHEGYQRFVFANGRVVLTLLVGDVHAQLPLLNATVDAWFLDGFSPAKNPQMWTDDLFKQLARLSKNDTTLATFTSAGFVRRGLTEAGFAIDKDIGFANKREMLFGHFVGNTDKITSRADIIPPWYCRLPAPVFTKRRAIVVGAGVAGASTAASLATRGWQVVVLEKREEVARAGSGNAQGILYLKLSAHQTLQSRLLLEGFGYTRRLLETLTVQGVLKKGEDWDGCGLLQLAFDDKELRRQQQLAEAFSSSLLSPVTQEGACQLAGLSVNHQGLLFPEGGWVKPRVLCQVLLTHPNIEVLCHQDVVSLAHDGQQWQAKGSSGVLASAEVVVLATAQDTKQFSATSKLPIKGIRGQTTELPANQRSESLSSVICSDGYISPAKDDKHCLGATFNFHAVDLLINKQEHAENIQTLKTISLDLAERLQVDNLALEDLEGRAAYRCTATDYLPIVGPIAQRDIFLEDYKVLIKDAKKIPDTPCSWVNGLFLNIAHGSRGLITAPLCGEMLASWLENEPLPIEQDLMEACHPNRFWVRELRYFRRAFE